MGKYSAEGQKIVEPIRWLFQALVMNKEEAVPKLDQSEKAGGKKLSLDMQAFSYSSATPLCFISCDRDRLGDIMSTNLYFSQMMSGDKSILDDKPNKLARTSSTSGFSAGSQGGALAGGGMPHKRRNINEFIAKELREYHLLKMQGVIFGDTFLKEHAKGFVITDDQKLIHCILMLQIVPHLNDGLQFVVYFKQTFLS